MDRELVALIAARKTLGWSQTTAGQRIGVSRSAITSVERGQNRSPRLRAHLTALYTAAGVDLTRCVSPTALRLRELVCLFCEHFYGEAGGCTICAPIRELVA